MRRRELLAGAATLAAVAGCAAPAAAPAPQVASGALPVGPVLQSIGFCSCIDQRRPAPIWDTVVAGKPDLFIFGGDNVYCEMPFTAERLREAYAMAAASPGMNRVRTIPHLAIWDDHDYGLNDGGAAFAHKGEAKAQFADFWRLAPDDPRLAREGLYHAQMFGPPDQRVQVIVLDARWFRSPWKRTDRRDEPGRERYVPDGDPAKTLLGPAQWGWLEEQLRQSAQLRLIVSGIQVVTEGHGWERWGNLPLERQRLYQLIARTRAQGVVFLSGDRHLGALYREVSGTPYPLHELTSSGITHPWRDAAEAGPNRLGELFVEPHYGTVDIDWAARSLALSVRDIAGQPRRTHAIAFDQLKVQS